ncbi:MAG: Gfo/Idh/MocA family oxidoreductase [Sphingobium sp.]
MGKPLRVGVISAHWGMVAHLPAWHALEGVEVHAVCTSRRETAEAAKAQYGLKRAYWDHAEMAADPDLDIIDVGTRPDLRRDMVIAALAQGKHVFAAANFAANIAAAREMRDAAKAAGKVVVLDSTLAEAPAHRQARRLIEEGFLGTPQTVATRLMISLFNGPKPIGDDWRWFGNRAHGASAMRNLGTHSLHLLVSLLGPVASVDADARIAIPEWNFPNGDRVVTEVEDTAHLLLRFENGVIGTAALGWSSPGLLGWRMELGGDRGTIMTRMEGGWFPSGPDIELWTGRDAEPLKQQQLDPELVDSPGLNFPEDGAYPPQTRDIALVMRGMVDEIRGQGRGQPDVDRAFHVEAVLEAARIAVAERRRVDVAGIEG